MTDIKFYSLEPDSRGDQLLLACRLVERIRAKNLSILIYCSEQTQALQLNRLLWTFRQDSFLPHGLLNTVDPVWTPILITTDNCPEIKREVLINLSLEIPTFVDCFEQVCEVIDRTPLSIDAGRERFRHYRERGYSLTHHSLRL